jgi:hypothetical protein
MGGAELAPFVSHPVAAVSVNARKPRPGQDSTSSSRQRVSTVSAQTAPGTLKVSPSSKAQQLGTPREAPGSPIIYTADSGPQWSSSRNIPPRLNN